MMLLNIVGVVVICYLIAVVSLWFYTAYLFSPKDTLVRGFRTLTVLGWDALNVCRMYRLMSMIKVPESPEVTVALAELAGTMEQWVNLDYSPLTALYVHRMDGIVKVISTLQGADINSTDSGIDGFTYLRQWVESTECTLTDPVKKSLSDVIEVIRTNAVAGNPDFSNCDHALNTQIGSAVLRHQIVKQLNKMISVTG